VVNVLTRNITFLTFALFFSGTVSEASTSSLGGSVLELSLAYDGRHSTLIVSVEAAYCDEHVYLSVCLSVSPQAHLRISE